MHGLFQKQIREIYSVKSVWSVVKLDSYRIYFQKSGRERGSTCIVGRKGLLLLSYEPDS
jgi:hypothetical protein